MTQIYLRDEDWQTEVLPVIRNLDFPVVVLIDDSVEIMDPSTFINDAVERDLIPTPPSVYMKVCHNALELKSTLYPWWHQGEPMEGQQK